MTLLTPEQEKLLADLADDPDRLEFLVRFADNYRAGRKFFCWCARALIGVGALMAAVGGGLAGLHQMFWAK